MRDARGACHPKCTRSTRAASAANTISAVERFEEADMLARLAERLFGRDSRPAVVHAGECVEDRERDGRGGSYERPGTSNIISAFGRTHAKN